MSWVVNLTLSLFCQNLDNEVLATKMHKAVLNLLEQSLDSCVPLTKESFSGLVPFDETIKSAVIDALWSQNGKTKQLLRTTLSILRNRSVIGCSISLPIDSALHWVRNEFVSKYGIFAERSVESLKCDEIVLEGLNEMESRTNQDAPLFEDLESLTIGDDCLDIYERSTRHSEIETMGHALRFYAHWFTISGHTDNGDGSMFPKVCEIVTLHLLSRQECIIAANYLYTTNCNNQCSLSASILLMHAMFGVSIAYWYLNPSTFMKFQKYTNQRFYLNGLGKEKLFEYNGDPRSIPLEFLKMRNQVLDCLRGKHCGLPSGVARIIGSFIGL